ncbi:hypothetical protein OROMI_003543 [Orobanche minor]
MVLRGIFLLRKKEIDWFYEGGAAALFPDAWEPFRDLIPENERGCFVDPYSKRLNSNDKETQVNVSGAGNETEAAKVARSVASSSLTKVAVYGMDPNWGRIACAAGYAGIPFNQSKLRISLGDVELMNNGSSENSSGNMGLPMEEVSSSDSDGSLFIHNEFGMCRTTTAIDHLGGSRKRSSDQFEFEAAAGNNVAEAGRSSSKATSKNRTLSILNRSWRLQNSLISNPDKSKSGFRIEERVVLLIRVTKDAKSAFDKALAEHEDIDDAVGSKEPTERDHGVDLQQPLLIKIDSPDSHQK